VGKSVADDKSKRGTLGALARLRKMTDGLIFGTDQQFTDENNTDVENIKGTINKIRRNFKQTTGEDIIEFFNQVESQTAKKEKDTLVARAQGSKKKMVNINDLVENPSTNLISDIMFMESNRINLYENYQLIYDHIPQMAQALDTYVDNILSPDDFTKDVFNLFYDGKSVRSADEDLDESDDQVINNLKEISRKYKIEEKAGPLIKDSLLKGDQFVAVLKLEKEFNKMLTEQQTSEIFKYTGTGSTTTQLIAEDVKITSAELEAWSELGLNESGAFGFLSESTLTEQQKMDKLSEAVVGMINENFEFTYDYHSLLEDTMTIRDDFKNELNSHGTDATDFLSTQYDYNGGTATDMYKGNTDSKGNVKDSTEVKMNGSVIKILEPDKVIKLSLDDVDYGYYYIEKLNNDSDFGEGELTTAFGNQLNWDKSKSVGLGIVNQTQRDFNLDKKNDLIVNTFVKTISKKIDKKFVMKNKDFKNMIYSLVRQGYLVDKKVKITYLSPSEVVHFAPLKSNDGEYGDSIYRKIFFVAKLYIAVLTSTLMQKISRSHDKRIYYIEVGLDNDSENAVQSFVRDVKNKEIKMDDLRDINTVLNYPGQFNDFYVPVVNGERPVEIDTIPGMDVEINNDFLDYLLKAMVSGIGVPATFLNYADEVEFMRSLAMQNGKFVRALIALQKLYGGYFSDLYRILYKNEYMYKENDSKSSNDKDSKKSKTPAKNSGDAELTAVDSIAYDKIQVKFPSPSSLNMTNLSDQINNSKDIIDFIVSTLVGDEADESKKMVARKTVAIDMLPSIDWDKYEGLISKALMTEYNENTLKNKASGLGLGDDSGQFGQDNSDQFGGDDYQSGGDNFGGDSSDNGEEQDSQDQDQDQSDDSAE
jgi:Bacteriophage T4-like portal protein (Gp20)